MKLIVGLGNYGGEYKNTRHNAGFMALDFYAKKNNLSIDKRKFKGLYTETKINDEKVLLLEPQTYMNLSGECVRDFMGYFHIDVKDLLVIYDDMDLDVGVIRLREKGSAGGHNGIKSIIAHLGTQEFPRVKVGVGEKPSRMDLADYVLDSGREVDTLLVEVSFYTLNAGYNTDRFATLEKTLNNPLAYCFNLEYNVNALTVAMDTLRGTPDTIESGDWTDADYLADDGTVLPLHRKLYDYTATITPRCKSWALNTEQFDRLHTLARRCQAEGVRLIVVLPPMADTIRTEVCDVFGITDVMQDTVLPQLTGWAAECGFTLLDYEWGGSAITDDDTQFFDGFHLDEKYGLPVWTQELFNDIAG